MGLYTNFHITGGGAAPCICTIFHSYDGDLHVVAPGFALGRLAKDGVLQPSDVVMEYALW